MSRVLEPYCERDPIADAGFCEQDVHGWFDLSYASYAVLTRTLLQEMPAEWQHRFVNLVDELDRAFPKAHGDYMVRLRDYTGRFIGDPLRNYRYPNQGAIEEARGEPS